MKYWICTTFELHTLIIFRCKIVYENNEIDYLEYGKKGIEVTFQNSLFLFFKLNIHDVFVSSFI